MMDWDDLESRPLSKIYTIFGYKCQQCGIWKPCWFSTRLLDEEMRKLENTSPTNPSFKHRFVKAVRRAEEIQRRGQEINGSLEHSDMVVT